MVAKEQQPALSCVFPPRKLTTIMVHAWCEILS